MFALGNMLDLIKRVFIKKHEESKKAFYCRALHGESTYNICINCDLTVSCNCQDWDGGGQIGDLRKNSFEEVFRGETAQYFREMLSRGKFPVKVCPSCPELQPLERCEIDTYLYNYDLPRKGIMVENTILCNLSCKFCSRETTQKIRHNHSMSLTDMELVARTICDVGIAQICFHNLGEPFVSSTFSQEVSLLRQHNPALCMYMSTNGVLIDSSEKVKAATEFHHIFFSIDGPSQDILVKYQVGGNFEKSYANMKKVVDERNRLGENTPIIEWKYVVFSWNDQEEHIEAAIKLARQAGIDLISFTLGGAPHEFVSTRYTESAYFQSLGEMSCRGKEIWFNR